MTHPTPVNDDLHRGRGWLNNAADVLTGAEDSMSSAEYARIAATLGAGFVALAHAERAAASSATLDAAAERVRRAAAEARPHDDEPEMTLGEALRHPLGHPVPNAEQPEPKHAVDDGVVWVVADANGPIHGALSQTSAQAWASDNADDFEGLSVTALELDRG